jgi:hypothetical protein
MIVARGFVELLVQPLDVPNRFATGSGCLNAGDMPRSSCLRAAIIRKGGYKPPVRSMALSKRLPL